MRSRDEVDMSEFLKPSAAERVAQLEAELANMGRLLTLETERNKELFNTLARVRPLLKKITTASGRTVYMDVRGADLMQALGDSTP